GSAGRSRSLSWRSPADSGTRPPDGRSGAAVVTSATLSGYHLRERDRRLPDMVDDSGLTGGMHIAMVAPPWFHIPPEAYGGIEEVVAGLTHALIARGHRVSLVGAGRDATPAEFLRTYREPPSERLGDPLPELLHSATAARLLAGLVA